MDGNEILLMGLNDASKSIIELRERSGITDDAIDYYVLHQAQRIIINGILEQCGVKQEKSLISYEEYGNTSAATIPVTICANATKINFKDRVKLCLCGFGVGLAWNGAIVDVDTKMIFPIEETDYKYADLPNGD